jgi:hypothetical protein
MLLPRPSEISSAAHGRRWPGATAHLDLTFDLDERGLISVESLRVFAALCNRLGLYKAIVDRG